MKESILLLFVLSAWILHAQNLVPNPGFDDLTDCPYDKGQITFAMPWVSASNGTPDLYNECSTEILMQVPNAGRYLDSYQLPRSGSGYASISVYSNSNSILSIEYIQTPIKAPLTKGTQYYLEFYVSPDFTPTQNYGFTDAVGMALSDTFYYKELIGGDVALPLNPVIENRGTVINDTVGWTRISGCYTAKGGEKYAIVGNFRPSSETIFEIVNPIYPFSNFFYIEDSKRY